jgi:hypothetical protein
LAERHYKPTSGFHQLDYLSKRAAPVLRRNGAVFSEVSPATFRDPRSRTKDLNDIGPKYDKNVTAKLFDYRWPSAHGQRHKTTVMRIEEMMLDSHGFHHIDLSDQSNIARHRLVWDLPLI